MDDLQDDDRALELSSIAAIYPELVVEQGPLFKASLNIPVSPGSPLKVFFTDRLGLDPTSFLISPTSDGPSDAGSSEDELDRTDINGDTEIHHLSNLPPLKLSIELPNGYPSEKPPGLNLTTVPNWLPESTVCKLLVDGINIWKDLGKDMMIFSYIDHLQQCAEDVFGLLRNPEDVLTFPQNIKIPLLGFDAKAQREKFEQETFVCGICLEPKKGSQCHRLLLCSHVFCVKCLQAFFNACIEEGDVDSVKCAAPGCGKEQPRRDAPTHDRNERRRKQDRTLSPSELLQIPLSQEAVHRYAFLKRKHKLESDKTMSYCPREWCQGAARSKKHPKPEDPIADYAEFSDGEEDSKPVGPEGDEDKGDEDRIIPPEERLAICEDCGYAFCRVCKKGWHGELINCYPRHQIQLSEEELATIRFIEDYTAACPSCSARCEKSHGCNHMICFKCKAHFCFLCSAWLNPSYPYGHFNTRDSKCYMRLWEGEEGVRVPRVNDWDFNGWDVASDDER